MIFSTGPIVKVGYFSKPHGFEGKLKFVTDSEIKFNLKEPVFVMIHEKPVPFFFEEIQGSNPKIVSLHTINTFEKAQDLVGKEVYATGFNADLEDLDWIGYSIHDSVLGKIGQIHEVLDHGVQKLALVNYNEQECMIPIVDAFFIEVDHDAKIIHSELPDGLLSITSNNNDEEE